MIGQIHLAHSAGTQYPNDSVPGKHRSLSQRHELMLTGASGALGGTDSALRGVTRLVDCRCLAFLLGDQAMKLTAA